MKPLAYAIVIACAALAVPLLGTAAADAPQGQAIAVACLPVHVSTEPPYVWTNPQCLRLQGP